MVEFTEEFEKGEMDLSHSSVGDDDALSDEDELTCTSSDVQQPAASGILA